jgi:hypothetical protein
MGETATQILTLGGNESDAVRNQFEPRAKLQVCRVSDTGPINDLSAGTEGPVSESLQGRNPRGLAGGSRSMGI